MQADASWGGNGNAYVGTAACFIFKLGGDGAASGRFDPSGANELYQQAGPSYWPQYGDGGPGPDLIMGGGGGGGGGLGGAYAKCHQDTYTAATNQVCGGQGNWGVTELVVLGR